MSTDTAIGQPNATAIIFFFIFIALTLAITWWAARKTNTTEEFFAAGRAISGRQNGFALAGGYAVQAHGILERPSEDVDLFTTMDAEDQFGTAVAGVVAA